ncbi:MAG: hypothetical protein ACE5K2_07950 [Candidatus Zixiibacteriota bacterium]
MRKTQQVVVLTLVVIWLCLIGKTIYQQLGPTPQEFRTLRRYHPGTKEYGEDRLAQIPQEFRTFWGRSLDEKRDLTTWEDLYRFLMWVEQKLPKGVDVGLRFSNSLYPYKAAYYLYPHNWRDHDILLIFGRKVSLDSEVFGKQTKQDAQIHLKKGFSVGQTFRTGKSTRTITSVDLMLNEEEWSSHEVLTLSVWESFEKNRKIGSKSLTGMEKIPGTDQQKFIFDFPLEVRPDTEYYFELTHNGRDNGFVGGVALSQKDPYQEGILFKNGVPEKGNDLWFILKGRDHDYQLIARYEENKCILIKISYLKKIMGNPVESERWRPTLKPYLE